MLFFNFIYYISIVKIVQERTISELLNALSKSEEIVKKLLHKEEETKKRHQAEIGAFQAELKHSNELLEKERENVRIAVSFLSYSQYLNFLQMSKIEIFGNEMLRPGTSTESVRQKPSTEIPKSNRKVLKNWKVKFLMFYFQEDKQLHVSQLSNKTSISEKIKPISSIPTNPKEETPDKTRKKIVKKIIQVPTKQIHPTTPRPPVQEISQKIPKNIIESDEEETENSIDYHTLLMDVSMEHGLYVFDKTEDEVNKENISNDRKKPRSEISQKTDKDDLNLSQIEKYKTARSLLKPKKRKKGNVTIEYEKLPKILSETDNRPTVTFEKETHTVFSDYDEGEEELAVLGNALP